MALGGRWLRLFATLPSLLALALLLWGDVGVRGDCFGEAYVEVGVGVGVVVVGVVVVVVIVEALSPAASTYRHKNTQPRRSAIRSSS